MAHQILKTIKKLYSRQYGGTAMLLEMCLRLQDDEEVVTAAISVSLYCLQYASQRLQSALKVTSGN